MLKLLNKKNHIKNNYLLIGVPNVGKSSFFNYATHSTTMVSNIDRMTTEHTFGIIRKHKNDQLIDLPGLYNLSHPVQEEIEVAHHIVEHKNNGIVNIISASSMERDLYLTLQCAETGMLKTLVINLIDKVNIQQINLFKLSKIFNNLSIVTTQTSKKRGITDAINKIIIDKPINSKIVMYPDKIEKLISSISNILPSMDIDKRYVSIMLMENNEYIVNFIKNNYKDKFEEIFKLINFSNSDEYSQIIWKTKNDFIKKALKDCIIDTSKFYKKDLSKQNKFDKYILNKWIGIPLFVLIIVLIYYITFGPYAGGWIQTNFSEFLINTVANNWITQLFNLMNAIPWVTGLFVSGIFGGLFIVLSFIPTIIILFTLIAIVQQIGLLSRVSVLLDNALSKYGLSGRSVVNLLTGFGCNVPAIMMARSSSSKKERLVCILIIPFIACGSRVIVFNFISNLIFSSSIGWIVTFLLVFFSGVIALLFAYIFSNTLFRKEKSFFLVEMVNWEKPSVQIILKSVWIQLKEFIIKASTIIVIFNLIVWLLMHIGIHGLIEPGSTDADIYKTSFLYYISYTFSYILYPIFGTANWQLTSTLIAAIPAKELIISNLQILGNGDPMSLFGGGENIALGLSYMVFIMFYLPCGATLFTIKKASSWKYLWITIGTGLLTAYVLSLLTYWITFGFMLL